MKILYLLDTLSPGGTEHSTLQLAAGLGELGVDTLIAVIRSGEHDLGDLATERGVRVIRLAPGRLPGRIRELRRLLRDERPDIVHTALYNADQLGRIATIGTKVRVVSSFVNTPYEEARLQDPNVTRWKLRTLQTLDAVTGRFRVDRFHSVSEGTRTANVRALRLPSDRVDVVERGRDTAHLGRASSERRHEVRDRLGVAHDASVVLSLGRQEHQKSQVDLIRAAAILHEERPDLRVLVAGKDGSASGVIRDALDSVDGLADVVHLLGHRTDIGDLLAAADALVISSLFEGTAGVALEAMSVGVPIVSTDIAGLEGVLAHGHNAVLVPPSAPDRLADGIRTVLDDAALAATLVRNGHEDFTRRFELDTSVRRMVEFYERVVAGTP